MNYTLDTIGIYDTWFEKNGKIMDIGVEGFHLFMNLFKYRVHGQEDYYTCITSISALTTECNNRKYTKNKVFDLLMDLCKLEVIEIRNISNPYAQLKKGGVVKGDTMLVIVVTDIDDPEQKKSKEQRSEDNIFVTWLSFKMIKHLQEYDERYLLLYALITKFSKGGDGVCTINIENMPDYIPLASGTCNRMIYELNNLHVLASTLKRLSNKKKKFEHVFCRIGKGKSVEDSIYEFWNNHGKEYMVKRGKKRRERVEVKS